MPSLPEYQDQETELRAGRALQDVVGIEYLQLRYPGQTYTLLDSRGDTEDYAFYDFLVVTKEGFPVEALEVKMRRCNLDTYDTAMFTEKKHKRAKRLLGTHHIVTYGVSRYEDGIGVADLTEDPEEWKWFKRKGHHLKAQKHGLWREEWRWEL